MAFSKGVAAVAIFTGSLALGFASPAGQTKLLTAPTTSRGMTGTRQHG